MSLESKIARLFYGYGIVLMIVGITEGIDLFSFIGGFLLGTGAIAKWEDE